MSVSYTIFNKLIELGFIRKFLLAVLKCITIDWAYIQVILTKRDNVKPWCASNFHSFLLFLLLFIEWL